MNIGLRGDWVLRERDKSGLVVAEKHIKNIATNYLLTNIGSALSGAFTAPLYLAVDSSFTYLHQAANIGDTTIYTTDNLFQVGDTQLTLGAGQSNQETVTFTSVSGTGPYTYALSTPLTFAHTTLDPDWVVRTPTAADAVTSLVSEMEYDSTDYPSTRMASPGGYSPGTGQWTVQFFFPGPTLQGYIMTAGLIDLPTLGVGQLHNHFIIGYNHNSTVNDLEIDGTFTFINV